jgi:hypothetical protein
MQRCVKSHDDNPDYRVVHNSALNIFMARVTKLFVDPTILPNITVIPAKAGLNLQEQI